MNIRYTYKHEGLPDAYRDHGEALNVPGETPLEAAEQIIHELNLQRGCGERPYVLLGAWEIPPALSDNTISQIP